MGSYGGGGQSTARVSFDGREEEKIPLQAMVGLLVFADVFNFLFFGFLFHFGGLFFVSFW